MTSPDNFFPEYPLEWEMSHAERFTLVGLLARLRPQVAIEIGTHFGGSLQVVNAFCGQVHSIDFDPAVRAQLLPMFPQVHFHCGPSAGLIPAVLREIEAGGAELGFVLVDGDHSAKGVRADLNALLQYRPRRGTVHILMHDSFNPDCRTGIRQAAWSACPHVHFLDLDFVPGAFIETAQGSAFARSMWGGFALAILRPEPRVGPLEIRQKQEAMHRVVFARSAHRLWHKVRRAIRRRFGR